MDCNRLCRRLVDLDRTVQRGLKGAEAVRNVRSSDELTFGAPIVTTIEPGKTFYRAEDYHQDFLAKNPTYPYIVYNDLPKIENLKRLFPDLYRPDPVLVGRVRSGRRAC